MATDCDACGYKTNEVKGGGAIPAKGKRIILKITQIEDLNRSILKSETAALTIPEKEIHLNTGTLGGRFTTIEGILTSIKEDLTGNPFMKGDSGEATLKERYQKLTQSLEKLVSGEEPFTIILEDPMANSYIQNLYAPDPDPNMTVEEYERTWEENEMFGLNDINTEDYETIDENNNSKK